MGKDMAASQWKSPMAVAYGATHVGRKRTNNEDSFAMRMDLGFCAVADGMGGAAAGETASRLFTEHAVEIFSHGSRHGEDDNEELVRNAFLRANQAIISHVDNYPLDAGMGCTGELLVIADDNYVIGHVGDSRIYLFRDGELMQLTHDHSIIQMQIDEGLLTREEAKTHPLRNVILRAVGASEDLAVDVIRGIAYPNDVFLLCSDGLTSMVEDSDLKRILSLDEVFPGKVERLIDEANSNGGLDNITVVLVQKT